MLRSGEPIVRSCVPLIAPIRDRKDYLFTLQIRPCSSHRRAIAFVVSNVRLPLANRRTRRVVRGYGLEANLPAHICEVISRAPQSPGASWGIPPTTALAAWGVIPRPHVGPLVPVLVPGTPEGLGWGRR